MHFLSSLPGLAAVGFTAAGVVHLLLYLLILACVLALIYWIGTMVLPAYARIIRIVCLVAFVICLILLLLPLLGA